MQGWRRHTICLMLWWEGCLHLEMRLHSPTRIPSQVAVYCVLQKHLSDVWSWIIRVKQCPLNCIKRCCKIFEKLVCYYIWTLYYIRTRIIINMDFLNSNLQWLSFKFNLHLLLLHLVGCVLLCHYVCYMCVL